ncbi:MAG: carbohydrate kinase family protein [Methylosarcina sp.]
MKQIVVGLGELLWDILPSGKQLGGAPANFIYHISALAQEKVEGIVASSVGSDELGKEIIRKIRHLSLEVNNIFVDSEHETGVVNVQLDAKGVPSYEIKEGVAWDYIPPLNDEFARRSAVVCFGSLAQRSPISRNSIQTFLSKTAPQCLRIFDINLRQNYYNKEIINDSLKAANVLKINDEELKTVSDLFGWVGSEEELLQQIVKNYNLRLGVLTKGEKGSILLDANGISRHSGYSVTVKDSVGAGDSFTATVALGLLVGKNLDSINDLANRVASYVCTKEGATPKLPMELIQKWT